MLVWSLAFSLALAAMAVSAAACGKEPTTLSTTLSASSVSEGTGVTDKAKLSGKNVSKATGKVKYDVYSESKCEHLVTAAGEGTVSGESVTASSEEVLEAGKSYYWQGTYEGNESNLGSSSTCGSEILDVKAKTTLASTLSGGGEEGGSIAVPEGASVKDAGKLEGKNVSTATGTVSYTYYSNGSCSGSGTSAGEVSVSGGSFAGSSSETLSVGEHSWKASYGGDSLHEASSSCATETVVKTPSAPVAGEVLSCNPADGQLDLVCGGAGVNDATGNKVVEQTDLSIGGRGPGLRVVRSYNSLAAAEASEAGPWGYGWTGPYDARLELDEAAGTATVHQEDGDSVVFYSGGGKYTQAEWTEARLVKEGSDYIFTLPDQDKLEFNGSGQLVQETDRFGNSLSMTYGSGKLEKVTDGAGRELKFEYNGGGQVDKVTDPMGHVIEYGYTAGNLTSVTIEAKVRWEFGYEASHLLSEVKDGRGHATTIKYDGSHRVVEQKQAGHTRKWEYASKETKLTEPNGSETVETFNSADEPTKVTRASGKSEEATSKYEYNAESYTLKKLIDPNEHDTEYTYDLQNNKTGEKDPEGDERKWTYDKKHDLESETTPEGETTTYTLDGDGEPETIERPSGSETEKIKYKYATNGDLEEETNALNETTKYTDDSYGDKATETAPEGNERKWKYNADSQATEETDPRGYTTVTTRNEQGWPTKIEDPLKHTSEYKYDGDGDVEAETDGDGHTTKYEYNEENLPTKVTEPNSDTIETEYDSEGQMIVRKDGNGHKWEYKRNALEQVTEEKNPLGKVWKKTYEKAGNPEKVEDPEGHTAEYSYDNAGRVTKITYSTGKPSEVTYEYNRDDLVKKMTDGTGTTENTWNGLDELEKYKNGAGKTVEYKYNLDNEPTTIVYPDGKMVTRAYDDDGLLESVTDWNDNITSFQYNTDGELEKTTFPVKTGDEDIYAYNEADDPAEVTMKGPLGATLGKLVYERDDDGWVKKTTTTTLPGPATDEDKYDTDSRLSEDDKQVYEYDKANNPTKIEGAGPYKYNNADQLEEGPEAKYAFNADGQRTKLEPKSGEPATTYSYDQAGNLTAIKRSKGTKEPEINDSFTYDGNNLRQTQTIGGSTTDLTWDTAEDLPLVLNDEANNYIYGPEDLPIEQISEGGTTLFLHHDQQGSTRLLTNTSGTTETTYTYNPYGTLDASTGTVSTPLRYDGQYTNTDTGLIYLRARVYDPKTAQFLGEDPELEETGEPYAYSEDNPVNGGDSTGLMGEMDSGAGESRGEGESQGGGNSGGRPVWWRFPDGHRIVEAWRSFVQGGRSLFQWGNDVIHSGTNGVIEGFNVFLSRGGDLFIWAGESTRDGIRYVWHHLDIADDGAGIVFRIGPPIYDFPNAPNFNIDGVARPGHRVPVLPHRP